MRRLLALYLVAYYAVVAGAVVTLWRSGLIMHLDREWTLLAIGLSVALGGVLAALSSRK
jgi:hypothetical protein